MGPLDITMLASRRPDLAERTLSSFKTGLFGRIIPRVLFLNINPASGSEGDAAQVEKVARSFFRNVVVQRPEAVSPAGAVKWLWSQPQSEWFLHLEEGWLLNRPLDPSRLLRDMEASRVVQVRFHNWTPLQRRSRPAEFTTSPCLIRTDFARMAASVIDADLHPEKQFLDDTNPTLQWAARKCRAIYHGGIFTPRIATELSPD